MSVVQAMPQFVPTTRGAVAAAMRALLLLIVVTTTAQVRAAAGGVTSAVPATSDAALVPPMVAFSLRDAGGRSLATPDDALGDLPALAVLDTGAGTHLLSHDTALRFGARADAGARWVETGLSGEHTLAVSTPYTVALDAGTPLLLPAQRLLLNDVPATAAAVLSNPGAIVDVVGMPALEHAIVELRLDAALGLPAVLLLPAGGTVHADRWVPLALVDFNHRRHPDNRGAPPTMAANPVLRGVRVVCGTRDVRGDWLLDTGSAVTLLSTAGARALALAEPAPLSAPVGGISGSEALRGWRVDRIELPTTTDGVLTVTDAAIFVHDVTTVTDDGTRTTLDGILGANLLAAFARVVIDVPHARLGFDLPPADDDLRRPRSPRR
ncbi:MAG: hypothetical protein HY271_16280 [Deltaproteobacteria bacterium]|nr:hypothetical protein [Deltaproteobacteria bacterium]